MSFHIYPQNAGADASAWLAALKSKNLPMWNSETGMRFSPWYTRYNKEDIFTYGIGYDATREPLVRMPLIIKNYAATIGVVDSGHTISKYIYYDSRTTGGPDFPVAYSLIEFDGTLRPLGAAFAILTHYFDKAIGAGRIIYSDSHNEAFVFNKSNTALAIAWTETPATYNKLTIALSSSQVSAVDVMGNPITLSGSSVSIPVSDMPIYLVGNGISVSSLTTALSSGTWGLGLASPSNLRVIK